MAASIEGPPPAGLDADYARCAQVTREKSSNFYYAFMPLPSESRRVWRGRLDV
jgi:hypothetical protein